MIPEYKFCTNCQQIKANSEYHTRKYKDTAYLKSYCKECSNKKCLDYQYDICKCGEKKTKKSHICAKCQVLSNTKFKTLGDVLHYHKYGKQVIYQPIRSRARTVIKDRKSCERCGYDKHVEACHIKPISSFPEDALIDTINSPNNLLALCPNCHWELDNLMGADGNDPTSES
jgi:hypothetical protein